jgi:hypothetical protein
MNYSSRSVTIYETSVTSVCLLLLITLMTNERVRRNRGWVKSKFLKRPIRVRTANNISTD